MASRQDTIIDPGPPPVGHFELIRSRPHQSLSGIVVDICGYREMIPGHFRQREAVSLVCPLVISFGAPFAIGLGRTPGDSDRFGTFAAGLSDCSVIIDSFGRSNCLQVNFTPLGAGRFFGLPMSELANRIVALDEVVGMDARTLRDRLGETPSWNERFNIVQSMILSRLATAPMPSPATTWAYARLLGSGGAERIGKIAAGLDWSRKHLVQKFRDEIGLPPKLVARIVRFNRALALRRSLDGNGWADIAAECGYSDQSHLVRDFAELAGETPTSWQSRLP
jgi:AraC-like DNA-binding protein